MRAQLLSVVGLLLVAGCGSDVQGERGSGSDTPATTSTTTAAAAGDGGGGGGGSAGGAGSGGVQTPPQCGSEACGPGQDCWSCLDGGASSSTHFVCSAVAPINDGTHPCEPVWSAEPCADSYDLECNCAACEDGGGTCIQACNFSPEVQCFLPGEPTANQFSCAGVVNCNKGSEACVTVSPVGDGCSDAFCADLPDACLGAPSCECLAPYIDGATYGASCSEDGSDVSLAYSGEANQPPWDAPWCDDLTCEPGESCWACVTDGGTVVDHYLCDASNPSAPAAQYCTAQWNAPPQ